MRLQATTNGLVVVMMALAGCSSNGAARRPAAGGGTGAAPAAAAPGATAAAVPLEGAFGGERWGFVEASSRDGRLVVLRRFTGAERPTFGHHGETDEEPVVTVFDRVSGQERDVDDIIDVDPTRRWLLLLDDGEVFLVDGSSGAWQPLGGDVDSDRNACLPPRQAAFSAGGKRVAWVSSGDAALAVRDLDSGEEWSIPATGRLWRGWPLDDGRAAVLAELAQGTGGWPEQRTSCACRWCNRFALSFGTYGWSGPPFTFHQVDEQGARKTVAGPPEGGGDWHGTTDAGCALAPSSEQDRLERGPWRWTCP